MYYTCTVHVYVLYVLCVCIIICYVLQVTQTNRKTKQHVPPPLVGVVKEEVEEDSKERDKLLARVSTLL